MGGGRFPRGRKYNRKNGKGEKNHIEKKGGVSAGREKSSPTRRGKTPAEEDWKKEIGSKKCFGNHRIVLCVEEGDT